MVAGLRRWDRLTSLDRSLLPFAVLFFLAPLITGGVGLSRYRGDALLLPASVMTRHLPGLVQLVLITSAVGLDFALARLFFAGALI
jgi:hypothetical protein